ncbi:hypothetical protein ABW19_dt0201100 [Dactylella cylindrospora]|nr:hypothetical protein ABW19_dt0201100 [Dactylella cylindrospora]
MQFSTLSLLTIVAAATSTLAYPAKPIPRQADSANDSVAALATRDSIGCIAASRSCRVYIKSPQCSDTWVTDVFNCIPEGCVETREKVTKACKEVSEEAAEGSEQ